MDSEHAPASNALPRSDVSAGVGLAGLAGLAVWILFCRQYPLIADALGWPGPRAVLSGPHAALAGLFAALVPMVWWSIVVDRVHRNRSTGLDWTRTRGWRDALPFSLVKLMGLWATWLIIGCLYALCRWYWSGDYLFAMKVLGWAAPAMIVLSVPYVLWIDRRMIEPRDSSWHFGALLLGEGGFDWSQIAAHWRTWIIKGFFTAFMISILPAGFKNIVEADFGAALGNPVAIAGILIGALFLVDVMIGTVGYIVTFRALDAHIRSGNPLLGGWIAALICYPPLVWGVVGHGQVLSYEHNVASWDHWLANYPAMLWLWAGLLVCLTAVYAWATFAFGLRFSNLTYRGVLTNGPYRFTRHPAYLSKNLFWWASVMPFLVTNGSLVDAIRNSFCLLVVNAIYYWRARTEEAHLLAEDSKYRAYHAAMARRGLITAPLARLSSALRARLTRLSGPTQSSDRAPQPAE